MVELARYFGSFVGLLLTLVIGLTLVGELFRNIIVP